MDHLYLAGIIVTTVFQNPDVSLQSLPYVVLNLE